MEFENCDRSRPPGNTACLMLCVQSLFLRGEKSGPVFARKKNAAHIVRKEHPLEGRDETKLEMGSWAHGTSQFLILEPIWSHWSWAWTEKRNVEFFRSPFWNGVKRSLRLSFSIYVSFNVDVFVSTWANSVPWVKPCQQTQKCTHKTRIWRGNGHLTPQIRFC